MKNSDRRVVGPPQVSGFGFRGHLQHSRGTGRGAEPRASHAVFLACVSHVVSRASHAVPLACPAGPADRAQDAFDRRAPRDALFRHSGFRILKNGVQASGFGFRLSGLRIRVWGFFVRVSVFGFRFRDSGFGFRVWTFGFRVS